MMVFCIIFIMLIIAITNKQKQNISVLFSRISILLLLYCILQKYLGFVNLDQDITIQNGLFCLSNTTFIFQSLIYIISIIIIQLSCFLPYLDNTLLGAMDSKTNLNLKPVLKFIARNNKYKLERIKISNRLLPEYCLIILFIITGSVFLISTYNFISLFLAIELQSYGLYLLSSIRKNSEYSTSGSLVYFLLGSLSSCFILLGLTLLYINTGTTNLESLYIIHNLSDLNSIWYKPYYVNFSFLILSIGLLFKISAAPFHFWSPDVYDSIPTIVTTFVAIIPKISIFILLLQLVFNTNNISIFEVNWTIIFLLSSALSLIVGTIGGLTQFRIKRLYAYSTISHVGFLLLSLSIQSIESIQAFLFYLIQYSISNLNAFIILIAIGWSSLSNNDGDNYSNLKDKSNSPVQLTSQLKGLFYKNPFLALSLSLTIYSFAGIPPLMGFFAKQMVLSAALDKGYIIISIIAIVTSVIGAIYYLNIIKEMYFNKFDALNIVVNKNISNNGYSSYNLLKKIKTDIKGFICFNISTLTLLTLLFLIIGNKQWLRMGTILVQIFFIS